MEKSNELPKNWILTTLDNVGEITTGNTPPKNDQFNYGDYLPWVKPPQLDNNTPIVDTPEKLSKNGSVLARILDKESVLISCIGDLGKIGIAGTKLATNQQINAVTFFDFVEPKFGYYFFKSTIFSNWLENNKSATVISIINKGRFSKAPFILPPSNEQKRIVSKIEELFSNLDAGRDVLIKTKIQLNQFKQSLLKKAFIGELTTEHRIKNHDDSISTLLKIMESNKSRQEKKLQKLPIPENTKPFHQIPNTWKWVRVGNVCLRLQYVTSEKANVSSDGIPVLRMGNIIDGELDFTNLKYYPKNWKNKDDFLLKSGDILFNRTNSPELVGKTAEYKNNYQEAVFASYLIRAIVDFKILKPSLLSYYVNSVFGRMFIKSVVSQQVGQANVNGTKFSLMLMPLIPMNEQKVLLDKIEIGISFIHKMKDEINVLLTNLFRMEHSILKQAFEGKLVPQDPNDEPASEILKRIKITIKN